MMSAACRGHTDVVKFCFEMVGAAGQGEIDIVQKKGRTYFGEAMTWAAECSRSTEYQLGWHVDLVCVCKN